MAEESWRGDKQRAELRGFARLRAILWPRSLRVVEWFSLGRFGWYRRLRWALAREFAGVDLHSQARLRGQDDIFGETPALTVVKLLELVQTLDDCPNKFVDLGSGRGLCCLVAANLGFDSVGFEREKLWVEKSRAVASRLGVDAGFEDGDFLAASWPEPSVVFTVGTAYSDEVKMGLAERFESLGEGSLVILGGPPFGSSTLEKVWNGPLPVEWGVIEFGIYRVGGVKQPPAD